MFGIIEQNPLSCPQLVAPKFYIMSLPYIAIGLIGIFFIYVLFLALTKRTKQLKTVLPPGIFFIAVWVAVYYFLLK